MKNFQNTRELMAYIKRNMEANPGISFDRFLKEMWERWDTVWWLSIPDIVNWKEWWYENVKQACEVPQASTDFSEYDEDIFSTEEPKSQKTISNSSNYDVARDFISRYNNLVKEKQDLLYEFNNWKWYMPGSEKYNEFHTKLDQLNKELSDMEDWDELYNLMSSIKENWLWDKFWQSATDIKNTFADIVNKRWSSISGVEWMTWNSKVSPNFKTLNWIVDQYLEWRWTKPVNNKENNLKKPDVVNEENSTDKMKFGQDVESQKYVNDRNKELWVLLANRWLISPEEIDNFLSQYDSWKNANQNDKNITLKNLSWIAQSNYNKIQWQRQKAEREKKDKERVEQCIWKKINLTPSNDSPLNWEEEGPRSKLTKIVTEDAAKKTAAANDRWWKSDWSDEANKSMDTYKKYMQLKAEWSNQSDMKKFFSNNVWVLWWNSEKKVKDNMKKAWLSNNQINDFVSDWKNTFKNDWTKKLEEKKEIKSQNILKNSPTITWLLKAKRK